MLNSSKNATLHLWTNYGLPVTAALVALLLSSLLSSKALGQDVVSGVIQDDAVTAAKIADAAVGSAAIANGSIATVDIADDAITGAKIADGVITGAHVATGAISSSDILDGSLTAVDLGAASVGSSEIADSSIATADIGTGAVTGAKIAALSIDTAHLAGAAVTTGKIIDNAITSAKIADNIIVADDIANNAVGTDEIADNAVGTLEIADSAITSAQVATGAITSSEILDFTITDRELGTGAVTTVKIDDNAVTSIKIADNTIVADDIANNAVGTLEIADSAVTSTQIADGTIVTIDLADSAVTSAKIAADTILAIDIATGAVTSDEILDGTITLADLHTDTREYFSEIEELHFSASQATTEVERIRDTVLTSASDDVKNAVSAINTAFFEQGIPLSSLNTVISRTATVDGEATTVNNTVAEVLQLIETADADAYRELQLALAPTLWATKEVGQRTDRISFTNTSGAVNVTPAVARRTAIPQGAYQNATVRAQTNYLADRLGLDPNEAGSRNGTVTSQVNLLHEQVDQLYTGVALSSALLVAPVPAGKLGAFGIAFANFRNKQAYGLSLASRVGSSSRVGFSVASSGTDEEDLILRLDWGFTW